MTIDGVQSSGGITAGEKQPVNAKKQLPKWMEDLKVSAFNVDPKAVINNVVNGGIGSDNGGQAASSTF